MPTAMIPDNAWVKQREKVVCLKGKLYLLPGGAVGRKVVSVYADEIKRFGKSKNLKNMYVFCL